MEARVIACTLTGSAHHLLTGRRFGTLFIDEAAQALEASCWIAIEKADRVIMAGDHRQLPPTIKCPEALKGGLDHTLMQQVVENKPTSVSMLTVQYRMCDAIMEFSNQEFYEGRLSSDPSVCYRSILDWETPILWIDTSTLSSCELNDNEQVDYKESEDGTSHMNPAEAKLAMQTLKDYFLHIGKQRILEEKIDVGVISPYKSQIRLLRHLLYKDPFWKPYRSLVSINTVDGFQGQERDIILISLVRSNDEGQIGFLHDLRRMNVAITRARMKLFLIGNKQTLCCHPFYKRLAEYVENVNKNEG